MSITSTIASRRPRPRRRTRTPRAGAEVATAPRDGSAPPAESAPAESVPVESVPVESVQVESVQAATTQTPEHRGQLAGEVSGIPPTDLLWTAYGAILGDWPTVISKPAGVRAPDTATSARPLPAAAGCWQCTARCWQC